MSLCRNELGVNRLVGQIKEVGLISSDSAQPLKRIVSEFVRDVALLRDVLSVYVQAIFARKIGPLSFKADPLVEARLRVVSRGSHVPLAKESGLIPRLL